MIEIDNVPMPVKPDRAKTLAQRINAMYIEGMAPLTIAAQLRVSLAIVRPHCHY